VKFIENFLASFPAGKMPSPDASPQNNVKIFFKIKVVKEFI
jgi:hypothetical protein